jgi:DNA-directed RNA polymerase sigma subunit (sigma70/sigma32)
LDEINGIKRCFDNKEIASEIGISSERVRQLANEGLSKIRKEYKKRLHEKI